VARWRGKSALPSWTTEVPPDSAPPADGKIHDRGLETTIRTRLRPTKGPIVTTFRKAALSSDEAAMVKRFVSEVVGMADRREPARDAVTRKVLTEIARRLEEEAPGHGLHLAIACGLPCARTIATSRKARRMKPAVS
jgi:hypothetical protein